jgi:acetyl esterase/lipase
VNCLLAIALLASANSPELDVVYASVGGRDLRLDLYKPAQASGAVPCVLVFHGGAWFSGNKRDMAPVCEAMARAGLAAATVEYRLAPKDRWPAQIDDCRAALGYLASNAGKHGLRADRFGACGASAGGHLALLLGLEPPGRADAETSSPPAARIVAVFNIFGPTDVREDFEPNLRNMVSNALIGKKYEDALEFAKEFSPVAHVRPTSPPVFTMHGDKDTVVPVRQAHRLDEALKAAGVRHELRIVPGMGHALPPGDEAVRKGLEEGIEFLRRELGS